MPGGMLWLFWKSCIFTNCLIPIGPTRIETAQPLNACSPMAVTELGMSIWSNDLHPLNALIPILLSPSCSTTFTNFVQSKNAQLSMEVTYGGIMI
jgi:hypothetical protein